MSLHYWCARVVALVAFSTVATVAASIRPVGAVATAAPTASAVRGVVWNSDNSPVVGIKLRLRNVQSGRIDGKAVSDDTGHFVFTSVPGGAYAVEVIDSDSKVIAVGQSFRIESGETVGTFVRLAPRQPWYMGVLSNTAATVISAASGAGVTALGSHAAPVSPQ